MNDLVLFDENDGLSEEQRRKLFRTFGNRLDSAEAPNMLDVTCKAQIDTGSVRLRSTFQLQAAAAFPLAA